MYEKCGAGRQDDRSYPFRLFVPDNTRDPNLAAVNQDFDGTLFSFG
jgi:hypothetical protein